jgi:hypothetical protein
MSKLAPGGEYCDEADIGVDKGVRIFREYRLPLLQDIVVLHR